MITNVSIQSATDKDTSTTADVATYENEIEILSPVAGTPGSGDGFNESNYDITYVPGDLTINRRAITPDSEWTRRSMEMPSHWGTPRLQHLIRMEIRFFRMES